MNHPGKFRSLLATLRIANAPSVVSNVLLGVAFGMVLTFKNEITPTIPILLCLTGLLLYFAGNLANDWYDHEWDKTQRPERALPSGLFNPTSYLASAVLLAVLGITCAFIVGMPCGICALIILALIAVYTRFHKASIWAVIPMGLCRASLYFLGFSGATAGYSQLRGLEHDTVVLTPGTWLIMLIPAAALFFYIVGLSLSARYEGMLDAPRGPQALSRFLLLLPLILIPCLFVNGTSIWIIGLLPYAVWLTLSFSLYRKPIPRYVSALLAGIPLIDFIAAAPLSMGFVRVDYSSPDGLIFQNEPCYAPLLIVPLGAFVLGRLLQRVASAT